MIRRHQRSGFIFSQIMPSRTLLFLVVLIQSFDVFLQVQGEKILFEQAYLKFVRHGKRQIFNNVEHIDNKIVPNDKRLIIVKTRSIEILYPEAIRNLKNLQDLLLSNCGILKIEPKAFWNLPNLTVLHLQNNQITKIKTGVFNNLPIKILSLHKNEIKEIEADAFDNMPNLFKIKLNSNRLKSWDSGWFKNCPKLTELYFRRNKLNYLPPSAFANIQGSHFVDGRMVLDTKIFLSKNKLGEINPESFFGLEEISQLYLDRNNIQMVPDRAFRDLREIDVMYLARNKIKEIKEQAFPEVRKIGILDLSSNLLECLPYELVTFANVTHLEKNNATCDCIGEFKAKLKTENRGCEISYDEETCPEGVFSN